MFYLLTLAKNILKCPNCPQLPKMYKIVLKCPRLAKMSLYHTVCPQFFSCYISSRRILERISNFKYARAQCSFYIPLIWILNTSYFVIRDFDWWSDNVYNFLTHVYQNSIWKAKINFHLQYSGQLIFVKFVTLWTSNLWSFGFNCAYFSPFLVHFSCFCFCRIVPIALYLE